MKLPDPVTLPVPLKDVERELSRQIQKMHGSSETPVQRARLANLVIFCRGGTACTEINSQLNEVLTYHPARVILLVANPEGQRADIQSSITIRPIRVGRDTF